MICCKSYILLVTLLVVVLRIQFICSFTFSTNNQRARWPRCATRHHSNVDQQFKDANGAATARCIVPQDIPITVLYEDLDMLVINKPSGMVMQFVPGSVENAVVYYLLYNSSVPVSNRSSSSSSNATASILNTCWPWKSPNSFEGIVHRIDKHTSGILVVAKHPVAARALHASFQERRVHKVYLAIAVGLPISDKSAVRQRINTLLLLEEAKADSSSSSSSEDSLRATKRLCKEIKRCGTNTDKALELLHESPDPTAASFSAAMNVCKRAGQRSKGLVVFDYMKSRGVVPSSKCFTKAIRFCAKEPPLYKKALELVEYMHTECELPLHPHIVSSAISACGLAGQVEPALELLFRLVDEQQQVGTETFNNEMMVGCFKAAISACDRCGATSSALEVKDKLCAMMDSRENPITASRAHGDLQSLNKKIVVDAPIGKMGSRVTPMGILPTSRGGREARSIVTPLAFDGVHSLNRVVIETGRTHQIRVHMAAVLGCPLVGDQNYNRHEDPSNRAERCMLHAAELTLPHPITGVMLTISCPPPPDFSLLTDKISIDSSVANELF